MLRQLVLGTLGFACFVACAHAQEPVAAATLTSADTADVALDTRPELRIASAVCTREERCNEIGQGATHESAAACVREVGARVKSELDGWSCDPAGTRARTKECLGSFASEPCGTIRALERRAELCPASASCGL